MITHTHMTPSSGYWNTQIPNINLKNYSFFSETLYDLWDLGFQQIIIAGK